MADNLLRLKAKRGGHRGTCTKLGKEVEELFANEHDEIAITRCTTIKTLLEDKLKTLNQLDEDILNICDIHDIENEIEESTEVTARILHVLTRIEEFLQRRLKKHEAQQKKPTDGHHNEQTNINDNGSQPKTSNVQHDANGSSNEQSTTILDTCKSSSEQSTSNNDESKIEKTTSEGNTNKVAKIDETVNDKETMQNYMKNTNAESNINTNQACGSSYVKAKLPKLTLPKFKGEITKWNSFWDTYESAIHVKQDISKIDKFNYLNSLLEGSAARAIQGLTLTNANYDAAIEILHERFGKPQQIIAAHMDELLKVPVTSGDKTSSLRFLYDKISVHVRGLSSLGVSAKQYGSLLIPIIMSKLPSNIRIEVARKTSNEVWDMEELLKIIQTEIEARELSDNVLTTDTKRSTYTQGTPPPHKTTFPHRQPTTGTFVSNEGYRPPQCVYCNEQHFSASCEKIKNVEERKAILMRSGRCFLCLKRGDHKVADCRSTKMCRLCKAKHHQSICDKRESKTMPSRDDEMPPISSPRSNDQNVHQHITVSGHSVTAQAKSKTTVLLQTARATAINPSNGQSTSVRILFDSGSQRTYVTDDIRDKLSLDILYKERLNLNTFGENNYKSKKCDAVTLQLQRPGHPEVFDVKCLSFPTICTPVPSKVNIEFPHLHGLDIGDNYNDEHGTIDILIGMDYYWHFIDGDCVRGESGPTAMNSKFGWILSGPLYIEDSVNCGCVVTNLIISDREPLTSIYQENDKLNSTLKKFWDTESIGIVDENIVYGCEQRSAKHFDSLSIQRAKDRYEVELPWSNDGLTLNSDHYQLSLNRLKGLQRRLQSKPELCKEYDNIIKDQLEKGVIERVTNNEIDSHQREDNGNTRVHYLPHHGVVREERTTSKLRVVYDGSAKDNQLDASINDCLDTGPNLIPKLFDILIRFRWNTIALTADIEKAFLMIGISPQHRDLLRFLWFKDPLNLNSEIEQFRFTRLVFGLRSSPAILSSTILHHLQLYQQQCPEIVELLSNQLYVDDFVTGTDSEEKAFEIYKLSKQVMSEGGFNLRKWTSNSIKLNERIFEDPNQKTMAKLTKHVIEDDQSYAKTSTGSSDNATRETHEVKLLGITWNNELDEFIFCLSDLLEYAKSLPVTKRTLLKLTAKIYDPLGFLSPFIVRLKILFQELCISRVNWDELLTGDILNKWNAIIVELEQSPNIHLPRCYFRLDCKPETVELHAFSDASSQAYAAVVYIRSTYPDGTISVNLLASKNKVAPIKKQSIPRLELLGAYILAKLVNTIIQSLPNELPVIYWVDSMTVLCWIKNDRIWKQYVRDRVNEIRRITDNESWRFCPGTLNPADLPTRGLTSTELSRNEVWWHGPQFLKLSESNWPSSVITKPLTTEIAESEVVKTTTKVYHTLSIGNSTKPEVSLDDVIDCNNFSCLKRLLRVTSYVLRFVHNLKAKLQQRKSKKIRITEFELHTGPLTATEVHEAENNWIQTVQIKQFRSELECLSSNTSNTRIQQFGLFLDDQDQIIKCKGRLDNVKLSEHALNPILLGSNHRFVHLIIRDYHERCFHGGVNNTLTHVRERFWIIHGRQIVKQFCKACVVCKRIQGLSYKSPNTGNLPSYRVSDDPPFTHTGVDFAGPLYIKYDDKELKSYVCLFTCASTRAIHLELTRTLTVESFLQAFRRFTSRRGVPATMISDNAKTFKSSSCEIRKICRSTEVQRYLTNNQITWRFIIEKASWWGGFYERMVQSVKRTLRKVIGRSSLQYDELNTLLVETESIINARPLTYVEDDQEGLTYALTPSHMIYGRRIANSPNAVHFELTSTYASLTRRMRHHQRLLLQFTKVWRTDYLSKLRENQLSKSKQQRSSSLTVTKGDVVIVKNDSTKRTFWKLAVVEELIEGQDGKVRAAVIKVLNSNGKITRLRRSVKHLYPIEVNNENNEVNNREKAAPLPHKEPEQFNSNRPRRAAAIIGELKRQTLGQ